MDFHNVSEVCFLYLLPVYCHFRVSSLQGHQVAKKIHGSKVLRVSKVQSE